MRAKVFCYAALVVSWAGLTALAADVPQARLVEEEKDHGSNFVGTPVKGTIVVENTGTVPFTITDAKTSCHCTTAVVSKGRVEPGQRGEVSYEIKTMSTGRSNKLIRIITDPPIPEALSFTATATFTPFIEVDPKLLTIEVPQGTAVKTSIPLTIAKGVEGVTIKGVSTRTRDVNVTLEKTADGGQAIALEAQAPLPPGKRQVRAQVQYVKDEDAVQDIIITINTLALVAVTPNPILVKFEPGKSEATVELTLKHEKGETFVIKSVIGQLARINDVKLPEKAAASYTLPITFVKEADRNLIRGFLQFEFEGELGKQSVPIIFPRDFGAPDPNVVQDPNAVTNKNTVPEQNAPVPLPAEKK